MPSRPPHRNLWGLQVEHVQAHTEDRTVSEKPPKWSEGFRTPTLFKMARLPIVAVVGRPNVGKSTLVNRIVGGRQAVVEEVAGVTRDRREFTAEWVGRRFVLVDTGGWEIAPGEPLAAAIASQAETAVRSADLVVFVVDGTTGVLEDDEGVIRILRSSDVPIVLAANKIDSEVLEFEIDELWRLGLGKPYPVSAIHGRSSGELLDAIVELLPPLPEPEIKDEIPCLAIVGRPNVGKSTLLNRLLGEERVIVSEIPGTTRDPIDALVEIDEKTYRLVDTAGIRRRPQITEDSDFYAVKRAEEALASADAALLVIDAPEAVSAQDQRIAGAAVEAGASIVVLLNKWDAIDDESRRLVESDLSERLGFISWAPVLRISAKTGARLKRLGEAIETVLETRKARIPTGELNRLVEQWTAAHPPPVRKGRRPKIQYVVQAGTEPPTFVMFVSGGDISADYLRYLERKIRSVIDLTGTPVRIITRDRN